MTAEREKIIQLARECGIYLEIPKQLEVFYHAAQREAVWAAADCQLARSCDRHGYDKYGDGDAIRDMAKEMK